MKKIFLFLILISAVSYCQNIKAGSELNIVTGSKNLSSLVGINLFVQYDFIELPISFQGNIRLNPFSEISNENKYIGSYSYTNYNFGLSFNYYPINWAIEPYIGIGTFYNLNDLSQSGMPRTINVKTVLLNNINNNLSLEIIGGIKFAANSPINFIVEVNYSFSNPEYELSLYSADWSEESANYTIENIQDKLDLNSLFLKLGLMFNL